jgi:DNA-directed RNA polymerase II subunit RPB2
MHRRPDSLVSSIKQLRRNLEIPKEISVVKDYISKEIRIFTDAGRVQRPLLICENGEPIIKKSHIQGLQQGELNWDDLLKKGLVEFLDVEEEETATIAMFVDQIGKSTNQSSSAIMHHTHCEVHPSMILGVCASIIPFPDHN